MHLAKNCLAICALLAASAASAHAALIVDDFSVTSGTWPRTLAPNSASTGLLEYTPTVLFGSRFPLLGSYTGPNPSLMQPSMAIYTPPGGTHNVFEVATPVNFRAYVTLGYRAFTTPETPVDLSAYSALVVHVDSYDLPDGQPLLASVTFRDNTSNTFEPGSYVPFAATSGDIVLPFSTVPTFDPTTIYQVIVNLLPAAGGDLRISSITAVPEPTTLTLFLPAASLALRRKTKPYLHN